MTCGVFQPGGGYVTGLTGFIDCRVEQLAEGGYLALAAQGSPVQVALAGLVTVLVALLGYRLMLGDRLDARHGVLAAVRLGAVLALATQWPAYQTLVYNLVIQGPAELTMAIAEPEGGSPAGLPRQIEAGYRTLDTLAHPRGTIASVQLQSGASALPAGPAAPMLSSLTIVEQKRLSTSAVVLLVSSLGALLPVRIAAGLLLALGPLFVICLLFDGLRGWFEGWVRALAGAALGSVGATTVLALELTVVEPQLAELVTGLQTGAVRPGSTTELFATLLLFAVVLAITLLLIVRAAAGFRLPDWRLSAIPGAAHAPSQVLAPAAPQTAAEQPSLPTRAQQISEAVRLLDQRAVSEQARHSGAVVRLAIANGREEPGQSAAGPLGRTYRRTTAPARSPVAARRDQR